MAATASFVQTYTRSGGPREIRPISSDPQSAFNWAGKMWNATSSIKFTVALADGSFWAEGNGTSAQGDFGEMGFERNGWFLDHELQGDDAGP